jgi:uncharacterized protein
MRQVGSELTLSATDLANFLGCRHRTGLDKAAALGKRQRPHREDPLLDLLKQRGEAHEAAYVASLQRDGLRVVNLEDVFKDGDRAQHVARTLDAMREGADVVVQGALSDGRWFGYADVLERVPSTSSLGAWSYEVTDTKLSRETRGGTILQLAVYTELLAALQGARPAYFHVVTPGRGGGPLVRASYRVDEYAAYFRWIRDQMLGTMALPEESIAERHYPEPVPHCDVCPWWKECDDRRRADDHLSLVANVGRVHRRELESRGVATLTGLAGLPVPIPFKPARGAAQTYVQARQQALVQLESRGRTPPLYRFRDLVEKEGFCRLPAPSPGDVFLDLEGDPLAVDGGREYLFGLVILGSSGIPEYRSWWALTEHEERAGFEQVMDLIMETWARHDGMHIYHYSPYEPAAFKRLMGRYATRGEELDRLLRGERFVDLYGVVRQGLYAGVERYSIKNLEAFYGFAREVDLAAANVGRGELERALELQRMDLVPREVYQTVEGYNRDDCVSTLRLRDWLERLRAELESTGATVPRPVQTESEASKDLTEQEKRVEALRARLLRDVPESRADRDEAQQARWLLSFMLDFHRREDKATWWEYFRLRDLPEDELPDEPQAIAGLQFVERVEVVRRKNSGKPTGSVVDRYTYPAQEMEIRRGAELKVFEGTFGKLVALDRNARTIDVKKGPQRAEEHPTAVFAHEYVNSKPIEDALFQLGERVADDGRPALDDVAAGDLLLRRPPRLRSAGFEARPGESITDFAVRIAGDLDRTVLAIQGPPGSGKTYTGARMICALVKAGKTVGVTANSHKVIRNLLDAVHKAAAEIGIAVRLAHKDAADDDDDDDDDGTVMAEAVREVEGNEEALELLELREVDVLGGTAWLWSRDGAKAAVDVLFVDEAGQMSLANTLAVSQAAGSVVLLGDPRQLEQPRKGTHPDGVGTSALQHLLGDKDTIPADRGIFLPLTYRLSPAICAFTSEVFYERRLESRPGLERQVLVGAGDFDGSGLWVVEMEHDGNRSASGEEVEVVGELVRQLTRDGVRWVAEDGRERPLTGDDILVVAPYNAQVSRLEEALAGTGARAGTVDKFQGQERPVVIYSMTTSRPEDAPRGMEFLYSLNRLNVATSRARCAVILVASPRLFEAECRTPRQMKLANGMCRFRELARKNGVRLDLSAG